MYILKNTLYHSLTTETEDPSVRIKRSCNSSIYYYIIILFHFNFSNSNLFFLKLYFIIGPVEISCLNNFKTLMKKQVKCLINDKNIAYNSKKKKKKIMSAL